jgi:hypothetical protein
MSMQALNKLDRFLIFFTIKDASTKVWSQPSKLQRAAACVPDEADRWNFVYPLAGVDYWDLQ